MESNSLGLYYYFYVVAKSKSFSLASKRLFISQPALSKAIKTLEDNLEKTLFIREHKGVKLTYDGEILFSHLEKAFHEINLAEEKIKNGAGTLKIGTSAVLCKYMLLPYLKEFKKENSDVKIDVECFSSGIAYKMLEEGRIDAALTVNPHSEEVYFFSLGEIYDVFAASASFLDSVGYTGEKKLDGREFEQLIKKSGGIMLLDKSNATRQHIDRYFSDEKIYAKDFEIMEVGAMDMLIEFTLTGLGIGCLIKNFITDSLSSGELREIPLVNTPKPREVGFLFSKKYPSGIGADKFYTYLKSIT